MIPTSIDGTDITGATIDGTDVQEITVDGDVVFSAVSVPATADLVFHLDASQESFSNNQTTNTITDFSGLNNNLSGDTVVYKTNQINGLPAFEFDVDTLSNNMSSVSTPFVFATVISYDVGNYKHGIAGDDQMGSGYFIQRDTGQFDTNHQFRVFGNALFYSEMPPLSTFLIQIYVFDGGNSQIIENGVTKTTGSLPTGTFNNKVVIGGLAQGRSDSMKGRIAEVLLYDASINLNDLNQYLSQKYNI